MNTRYWSGTALSVSSSIANEQAVTAVIPTWNRASLLGHILDNLHNQTRPPEHILVIDNGSTDGSREVAQSRGAQVIAFPENRGFAVAVNEGIRLAQTPLVLLVNNDVELQADWLHRATAALKQERADFICGKLLRQDGTLDGSFDLLSRGAYAWRSGYGKQDGPVWSAKRAAVWAPMTAVLYRRSLFENAGYLDERFESYYEDVEFGLRCALVQARGVYDPALVAYHTSKTTLGRYSQRVYFNTARNQVYLLALHFATKTLRRWWWPILTGQLLSLVAAARQRNFWAAVQGKLTGLRQWKRIRRGISPEAAALIEKALDASEREIFKLQNQAGWDLYWRAYFKLNPAGSNRR